MAAHGARMMFQGLFHPNSYYPAPTPMTFDFWFDWTTLLILGLIIFYLGVSSFYIKEKTNTKTNVKAKTKPKVRYS